MHCKTNRRAALRAVLSALLVCVPVLAPDDAKGALDLSETHAGDLTTHYTDVNYLPDAHSTTGMLTAIGYSDELAVSLAKTQDFQFEPGI